MQRVSAPIPIVSPKGIGLSAEGIFKRPLSAASTFSVFVPRSKRRCCYGDSSSSSLPQSRARSVSPTRSSHFPCSPMEQRNEVHGWCDDSCVAVADVELNVVSPPHQLLFRPIEQPSESTGLRHHSPDSGKAAELRQAMQRQWLPMFPLPTAATTTTTTTTAGTTEAATATTDVKKTSVSRKSLPPLLQFPIEFSAGSFNCSSRDKRSPRRGSRSSSRALRVRSLTGGSDASLSSTPFSGSGRASACSFDPSPRASSLRSEDGFFLTAAVAFFDSHAPFVSMTAAATATNDSIAEDAEDDVELLRIARACKSSLSESAVTDSELSLRSAVQMNAASSPLDSSRAASFRGNSCCHSEFNETEDESDDRFSSSSMLNASCHSTASSAAGCATNSSSGRNSSNFRAGSGCCGTATAAVVAAAAAEKHARFTPLIEQFSAFGVSAPEFVPISRGDEWDDPNYTPLAAAASVVATIAATADDEDVDLYII